MPVCAWDKPLLGKPVETGISLVDHTRSVVSMAELIIESVGEDLLRAIGLKRRYLLRFRRLLITCCHLHDIGKANDQFQERMYGLTKQAQSIRHEALSYYLLTQYPYRDWIIKQVGRRDYYLVLWAIAGHHRDFLPNTREGNPSVSLFLAHPDMKYMFPGIPTQEDLHLRVPKLQYDDCFSEAQSEKILSAIKLKDSEKSLLALLKTCLISADILGSINGNRTEPEDSMIATLKRCLSLQIEPGVLEAVIRKHLNGQKMTKAQEHIEYKEGCVTLLKAGCGNGKTIMAYSWAKKVAAKRFFFCYPTMWAVGMGFDNYLQEEAVPSRFFHHMAHLDARMSDLKHADGDMVQLSAARHALSLYAAPIISCTHDSILGVIRCGLTGILSLLVSCNAAIVFDEVQLYSDYEFDALISFIKNFPGIPTLIMSATPRWDREREISEASAQGGRSLNIIDVSSDHETAPRYRRSIEDPEEEARNAVARGEKVLWISNTVSRCISVYDNHENSICCHGHFKYRHKVIQQQKIEHAFKHTNGVLVSATQVAESSLNLNADLLVTDLSAIWSLIQRLGRLNRGWECLSSKKFIVIDKLPSLFPYDKEDIRQSVNWLNRLPDSDLSQAKLMEVWKEIHEDFPRQKTLGVDLFKGLYNTKSAKTRLSPGFQVQLIMACDEHEVASDPTGKSLSELKLTMFLPREYKSTIDSWKVFRGCKVVPDGYISYEKHRGAQWLV